MSKKRFALLIAVALCVGASAGAYKPQCKDSSGRLIVCTGTLDNTQAPTAPAMSGANITANTVPAGAIVPGTIDNTEFGYLDGLTENVQSKLDSLTAGLALATAGGNTFYLQETASDISGYETLRTQPSTAAEDFDEKVVTSATSPLLIDPYATEPDALQLAQWPAGNWIFHVHSSVDNNTGDTRVRADVYSRTVGGVETLRFTATSPELAVGTTDYQWSTVQPEYQLTAQTDRLVIKFYATTTSVAARTVRIYYQGSTQTSYVTTPIPSPLPISGPANQVLATPNGSTGAVGPRALVYGDLSALVGSTAGTLAAGNASIGFTQPAAGLTVTSSVALGAAATFALANDLAALEGLVSTGLAARTGTDTWAQRSIAAGTGLSVSNGNGVSGNPTVSAGTELAGLSALATTGFVQRTGAGTYGTTSAIDLNTNTTGVTPTAKGGTNLSIFTPGGVFYASDSSSVSFVGPGTAGYVLTSNGTSPTMAAPVTATNSCASMSAGSYALTTSYGNIGLPLTLTPGTWLYVANVRTQIQASAGTVNAGLRLYNSTAGSAISNSDRFTNYSSGTLEGQTTPIMELITVGVTSTIDVQALKSAGSFTTATANHDASGYSRACAVKISS
jgi:hypothetical protein